MAVMNGKDLIKEVDDVWKRALQLKNERFGLPFFLSAIPTCWNNITQ